MRYQIRKGFNSFLLEIYTNKKPFRNIYNKIIIIYNFFVIFQELILLDVLENELVINNNILYN